MRGPRDDQLFGYAVDRKNIHMARIEDDHERQVCNKAVKGT